MNSVIWALETITMKFTEALKKKGWTEVQESVRYTKNDWEIVFDTSSWMEIGTKSNSRIADIFVPDSNDYEATIEKIEALCESEDDIHKN